MLRDALGAFLKYGFHAATLSQIEAATGSTWSELCQRYVDKEGLFVAAAEQGLLDGSIAALNRKAEVLEMLSRLERINGNPRLRAIHKMALAKMRSLAEGQGQGDAG